MTSGLSLPEFAEAISDRINTPVNVDETTEFGLILTEQLATSIREALLSLVDREACDPIMFGALDEANPNYRPNECRKGLIMPGYGFQRLVLESLGNSFRLIPTASVHGVGRGHHNNSDSAFFDILTGGLSAYRNGSFINDLVANTNPDLGEVYGNGLPTYPLDFGKELTSFPVADYSELSNAGCRFSVVAMQSSEPSFEFMRGARHVDELSMGSVFPTDLIGIVHLPSEGNSHDFIERFMRSVEQIRDHAAGEGFKNPERLMCNLLFMKEGEVFEKRLDHFSPRYNAAWNLISPSGGQL